MNLANQTAELQSVWRDSPTRFGRVSRALHWSTAALVLGCFLLAWIWDYPGRGLLQTALVEWHRSIGIAIMFVAVVRLVWRAVSTRPSLAGMPIWNRLLAWTVQASLYGLLALLPLTGWAYTNAGGLPVTWLGLTLPALVSRDRYFAEISVTLHNVLVNIFLAAIGLHIAGALWHWLVIRDGIAQRMFGKPNI